MKEASTLDVEIRPLVTRKSITLPLSGREYPELDSRTPFSSQFAQHILMGYADCRNCIDRNNTITGSDPYGGTGTSRKRRHDKKSVIDYIELYPYAVEIPIELRLRKGNLFRLEIDRMRIKRPNHTFDARSRKTVGLNIIDVQIPYEVVCIEHFPRGTRTLLTAPVQPGAEKDTENKYGSHDKDG